MSGAWFPTREGAPVETWGAALDAAPRAARAMVSAQSGGRGAEVDSILDEYQDADALDALAMALGHLVVELVAAWRRPVEPSRWEPWATCHVCGLDVPLDSGVLGEHPTLGPSPLETCDGAGAEPLWLDRGPGEC